MAAARSETVGWPALARHLLEAGGGGSGRQQGVGGGGAQVQWEPPARCKLAAHRPGPPADRPAARGGQERPHQTLNQMVWPPCLLPRPADSCA